MRPTADRQSVNIWLRKDFQDRVDSTPEEFKFELEAKNGALCEEELFALAATYDRLREPDRSAQICRQLLQKNWGHIPSLFALCLLSFENKKFEEAQRWFRRALHFDRSSMAAEATLFIHQRLRTRLSVTESGRSGLWLLETLHKSERSSVEALFEYGKMLFERSQFETSALVMKKVLDHKELGFEATQYLSYIYERLYSGDELIEKTLELASEVKDRSDLFFNLAMIAQHDENRPHLSLSLFYLASQSDPQDPGLRFSLEQACLELIGQISKSPKAMDQFHLMIAHLFHGSLALAKRYAQILRDRHDWRFPESFQLLEPHGLWKDWLLVDQGVLGEALQQWFGDAQSDDWQSLRRSRQESTPGH